MSLEPCDIGLPSTPTGDAGVFSSFQARFGWRKICHSPRPLLNLASKKPALHRSFHSFLDRIAAHGRHLVLSRRTDSRDGAPQPQFPGSPLAVGIPLFFSPSTGISSFLSF